MWELACLLPQVDCISIEDQRTPADLNAAGV